MADMTDQREETWLTQQLGECPAYEMPRADLLELLTRHAEHVRLEALGELYRKMDSDRGMAIRYVACWREVRNLVYRLMGESRAA